MPTEIDGPREIIQPPIWGLALMGLVVGLVIFVLVGCEVTYADTANVPDGWIRTNIHLERDYFRSDGVLYLYTKAPEGVVEIDGKLYNLQDHEFSFKIVEGDSLQEE